VGQYPLHSEATDADVRRYESKGLCLSVSSYHLMKSAHKPSSLGRVRARHVLPEICMRHASRPVRPQFPSASNGYGFFDFRMNWLDPPAEPPNTAPPTDPSAPSEHNLNYWAARLQPLHDPTPGYDSREVAGEGKEVVFVSCNRVGTEEGTSCSRRDKQGY